MLIVVERSRARGSFLLGIIIFQRVNDILNRVGPSWFDSVGVVGYGTQEWGAVLGAILSD